MKVLKILTCFVVATLVLGLCITARANVTYPFECITNNNLADATIGEAQLSVEVTDLGFNIDMGHNQVLFTFANEGTEYCSIEQVYFDDDSLLDIARLIDADQGGGDPKVDFTEGSANPGDLPGGNAIGFAVTSGLLAGADKGKDNVVHKSYKSGVEPGQSLGVVFDLQGGQDFDDVIADLTSRDLRIGIHVQRFNSGGSESFVNNGITPAPGAILLGSVGVGLVSWLRRCRMF